MDALRFVAMHDSGKVEELAERKRIKRLTVSGGWKKRWNHWGGRVCLTTEVLPEILYMPYIRWEEEGV